MFLETCLNQYVSSINGCKCLFNIRRSNISLDAYQAYSLNTSNHGNVFQIKISGRNQKSFINGISKIVDSGIASLTKQPYASAWFLKILNIEREMAIKESLELYLLTGNMIQSRFSTMNKK